MARQNKERSRVKEAATDCQSLGDAEGERTSLQKEYLKRVLSDVVPQAGVGKWADDSGNEGGRQRQRVSECKGRRCIC